MRRAWTTSPFSAMSLRDVVFTIVITGIYVRRANTEFDALTAEILAKETK